MKTAKVLLAALVSLAFIISDVVFPQAAMADGLAGTWSDAGVPFDGIFAHDSIFAVAGGVLYDAISYGNPETNKSCVVIEKYTGSGWTAVSGEITDAYKISFQSDGTSLYLSYLNLPGETPTVLQCSNPGDDSPSWNVLGSVGFLPSRLVTMNMAAADGVVYASCVIWGGSIGYIYKFDTANPEGGWSALGTPFTDVVNDNISLAIHDDIPYVAYNDPDSRNGALMKFENGSWQNVPSGLNIYGMNPDQMCFAQDGSLYLLYQEYDTKKGAYYYGLMVDDFDTPAYYTIRYGQYIYGAMAMKDNNVCISLSLKDTDTNVYWYDSAGVHDLGVLSGSDGKYKAGVAIFGGVPYATLNTSDTRMAAMQYTPERSAAPAASSVTVANNSGIPDTITITGLTAGDEVSLFADAACESLMDWTKVGTGRSSVCFIVDQLGATAGSVYITRKQPGKWMSNPTKKDYGREIVKYTVDASVNDDTMGSVTGTGDFVSGTTCNLIATPKSGCRFVNWTEGSDAVSTRALYAFAVTGNRELVGNFEKIGTPSLAVPASAGYNSVKLSWSAVAGAKGYYVYRATSSGGTYSKVADVTALTYTNTGLACGASYYYKVSAYCVTGRTTTEGDASDYRKAVPVPSTPTGLKAVRASYTSVRLTWYAVPGATKYMVYRATSKTGAYTYVGETSSLAFTNTRLRHGTTYYFKIRAYRLVGSVKVYSSNYSAVVYCRP